VGAPRIIGHYELPADKPSVTEFIERMPAKGTLKPMPYHLHKGTIKGHDRL